MRVAGESENYEFLEYLAPRDGRQIPSDERSSDLAHWPTVLLVGSAEATARNLFMARYPFVSSGVVVVNEMSLGFAQSFLVRDPDGHVIQLVEK